MDDMLLKFVKICQLSILSLRSLDRIHKKYELGNSIDFIDKRGTMGFVGGYRFKKICRSSVFPVDRTWN